MVVLDKSHYPRVKVCGSGLSPHAQDMLERLGLRRGLIPRRGVIDTLQVRGPDGDQRSLNAGIEAWVVLRPELSCAPGSLTDHVASLIAWHKRPRVVHAVESLPRNAMGKVVKSRLGSP